MHAADGTSAHQAVARWILKKLPANWAELVTMARFPSNGKIPVWIANLEQKKPLRSSNVFCDSLPLAACLILHSLKAKATPDRFRQTQLTKRADRHDLPFFIWIYV
jgi:hypothetical protein